MFEEIPIILCDGKLGVHSSKFKGRVQSSIIVESVMVDMKFEYRGIWESTHAVNMHA